MSKLGSVPSSLDKVGVHMFIVSNKQVLRTLRNQNIAYTLRAIERPEVNKMTAHCKSELLKSGSEQDKTIVTPIRLQHFNLQ
jgi:hypothetical protein